MRTEPGRTDLEQKSSFATRRRIYIRREGGNGDKTKNNKKPGKPKVFDLNFLKSNVLKSGDANFKASPLVFCLVLTKCDSPLYLFLRYFLISTAQASRIISPFII